MQINMLIRSLCRGVWGVANKTSGFLLQACFIVYVLCILLLTSMRSWYRCLEHLAHLTLSPRLLDSMRTFLAALQHTAIFSGHCLPLGAPSGRGGRGSDSPYGRAHALCAFPSQQGTEGGALPNTHASFLETYNPNAVGFWTTLLGVT